MRLRLLLPLLALCGACASESGSDEPLEPTPRTEPAAPDECRLSALGSSIATAAAASNPDVSLVPLDQVLSYDNVAGPALIEGEEIFTALGAMIAEAEVDANLAFFDWEVGSDPSDALLDGLLALDERLNDERAANKGVWERAPVQVRITVNAPRFNPQLVAEPLRRAVDAIDLDERLVEVHVGTRPAFTFGVMHEKLAVIDGLHVHIGGANVQGYNDWTHDYPSWWDSAYVLSGSVAQSALHVFESHWAESSVWQCDYNSCEQAPAQPFERTVAEPMDDACTPMIALNRRPVGEPNNDIDSAQDAGYLAGMNGARSHIHIQTPNLNDDAAKDALLDAMARGVQVRVVLPLGFNDNFAGPLIFGQGGTNDENADELYERARQVLADAGKDPETVCDVLDIRWFSRRQPDGSILLIDDRECETLPEDACAGGHVHGAAHAKYMSVDDQVVFVGSLNQDTQSWNNAGETNVAIDSVEATERYDSRLFDPAFEIATPTYHCDR
ncbi:MAG: phosphatidylserine/phosphatidylglycerophosphate/cardiolipin synthase family protein [Deltaproteobacteria bacterium]|nr:phosphatidylserine/phosphatidylglycerophosphate/cardiolipin synthase family protein [Deltaproteobacteria bacterium]